MKAEKRVREIALDTILKVEKKQAFSNLALNESILRYELNKLDASLLTELVYGTLQRKMTLDFFLEPFIKGQKKIDLWVRILLRMSIFQMVYLEKIPDRAVIHEAVEIAKKRSHKGTSGFINGVLRAIQRKGLPSFDSISDPIERISIEYSHPRWIVERWVRQFGLERTEEMCSENLKPTSQTARVNAWKITPKEALQLLEKEGFPAELSEHIPIAIKSVEGNIASTNCFKEGYLTIQDESSMLVGYAMAPVEGERILDACAAPGGKTTHIAERMNNSGEVVALDLHEHKVKLIKENMNRLGLTNIIPKKMDSRKMDEYFPPESFDRILVDAPCSGLGVVRRKPDIKYSKSEKDILKLAEVQYELLDVASKLLKKGGLLVYSTCTVDWEENSGVARKFLEKHPEFEGDIDLSERMPKSLRHLVKGYELEILPQDIKSDGFYIACFKKKV